MATNPLRKPTLLVAGVLLVDCVYQPGTELAGPHRDGGRVFRADSYESMATPSCLKLFAQLLRRALSRAACTAGSKRPTSVPMIAITTSSSTSVNPRRPAKAQRGQTSEIGCLCISPPED